MTSFKINGEKWSKLLNVPFVGDLKAAKSASKFHILIKAIDKFQPLAVINLKNLVVA